MKEFKPMCGEEIGCACVTLVEMAPAFMVFNDVRVEAQPGDTPGDVRARWSAGMSKAHEEHEAKRRAYERTPEGKAEIAAAQARAEAERRARTDLLQRVADSGVREKYQWPEPSEVSGFGGGYEAACRDMIYAGLMWLETNEADEAALSEVVAQACPDCSGAMHGAAMSVCLYVKKNGWPAYVEAMNRRSARSM